MFRRRTACAIALVAGLLGLTPGYSSAASLSATSTRPQLVPVTAVTTGTTLPPVDSLCASLATPPQHAVPSARIKEFTIAGDRVSVYLPPGYATSGRRYPVLYMLPGGQNTQDTYLVNPTFLSLLKGVPIDRQFIVVSPDGGAAGYYLNWKDGSHAYETLVINDLVPAIDHTFRTLANRKGRAIAGVSMGGWGAAYLAMTHPQLFSVVASISGPPDDQQPNVASLMVASALLERHCQDRLPSGSYDPDGMLGNPQTDAAAWKAANPTAHPQAFRGMHIFLTAANGQPCDAADRASLAASATPGVVEMAAGLGMAKFRAALQSAGIPSTYEPRSCGLHEDRYFDPALRRMFPFLVRWM